MNFATIYSKIFTLEMFLSQHDESVTSPEQVETFTDDRLTGLQLYGKFHGYYESLSREEPNLETVHVKIIKQLEKFAENFENKWFHLITFNSIAWASYDMIAKKKFTYYDFIS